jgi:hypothetical protein
MHAHRATGLSELKGYKTKKDPLSMWFLSRVAEAGKQILRYDRYVDNANKSYKHAVAVEYYLTCPRIEQ